jgi:Cu-Zn family superoxide dismutase
MGRSTIWLAASVAGTFALASPALAVDTASAVLKDASGKDVGKATLTVTPSGVLVSLDLAAVPAGEHAFHIHAVGKCEPPDFKSAGPHFNPDETKHGLLNPEGPHAGDMPNLHVPADGKWQVEILVPAVTLSAEAALSTPTAPRSSFMRRPTTTRPTQPGTPGTASPAA